MSFILSFIPYFYFYTYRYAVKKMKVANCWFLLSSLRSSVLPSIPGFQTVYRITRSETSSTTKKKPGPKKLTMDDSDKEVLRRTVREIMSIDKVLPTTAIILKDMQEKIGGETNLRSILKAVGFRCECLHCS